MDEIGVAVIEGKSGMQVTGEKPIELTEAEIQFQITKHNLFGSRKEPAIHERNFVPITNVTDRNVLVSNLREALKRGGNYYRELSKAAKNQIVGEKERTMFERAVEVVEGKRENTDSLIQSINSLAADGLNSAEQERKQRINDLYDRETRRTGSQALGVLLRGKEGQMWSVGGQEIREFHDDTVNHIFAVRDTVKAIAPTLARQPKT